MTTLLKDLTFAAVKWSCVCTARTLGDGRIVSEPEFLGYVRQLLAYAQTGKTPHDPVAQMIETVCAVNEISDIDLAYFPLDVPVDPLTHEMARVGWKPRLKSLGELGMVLFAAKARHDIACGQPVCARAVLVLASLDPITLAKDPRSPHSPKTPYEWMRETPGTAEVFEQVSCLRGQLHFHEGKASARQVRPFLVYAQVPGFEASGRTA